MLTQMALFHSFLWLSSILLYTYTTSPHLLYPFICQWMLGCFHALAIVNSAGRNIRVHISFQVRGFIFPEYMLGAFNVCCLSNLYKESSCQHILDLCYT